MLDMGIVHYRLGQKENTIEAKWYTTRMNEKEMGTGIATGDTSNGFSGEYVIRYTNPDGTQAGPFDLKIVSSGSVYDLTWLSQGSILFIGVGIETENGLAAAYRKVEDA